MARYGLPIEELPARGVDAIEAAERDRAITVVLRGGAAVAGIVPADDVDRIDPPDPGAAGGDPLLALCGSCSCDEFADAVLLASGAPIPYRPPR